MSTPDEKPAAAPTMSDPLVDQVKSAVATLLVTATGAMETDVKALLAQNGAADAHQSKDLQSLTTYALNLLRERLGAVLAAQPSTPPASQSQTTKE